MQMSHSFAPDASRTMTGNGTALLALGLLSILVSGLFDHDAASPLSTAALAFGLAFCSAAAWQKLVAANWSKIAASLLLLCVLANALTLSTVSVDHQHILLVCVVVLAVASVRAVLVQDDAQSYINLSVVIAASALIPEMRPLIVILAFIPPLVKPVTRRDPRAFVGTLVVVLAPLAILACAIAALHLQDVGWMNHGMLPTSEQLPWRRQIDFEPIVRSALVALPMFALLTAAIMNGKLPGKTRFHALVALAIPCAIEISGFHLIAQGNAWLLGLTLVFATLAWLSLNPVSKAIRSASLVAFTATALLSWIQSAPWADKLLSAMQFGTTLATHCLTSGLCLVADLRPGFGL